MGAGSEVNLEEEQAKALALARARMRAKQQEVPAEEPGMLDEAGRQLGLAARSVGPKAAGAMAGAAAGSVVPGVGTVAGGMAGLTAATVLEAVDKFFGRNYLDKLMTKMGLPKPQNDTERLAAEGVDAAGGALGVAAVVGLLNKANKLRALAPLAQQPGMAAVSAASGGMAQEAVRQDPPGVVPPELGGNQTEQLLANMAGSVGPAVVGPPLAAAGRAVGAKIGDVGHAVGAAMGRPASVERLAGDAVQALVKDNPAEIKAALANATTHVPGTKPTVAEALAERNLAVPDRQVGGGLIRMQDTISGARGAEDVLPSAMKANQAAIEKYLADLKARTGVMRDEAFRNARQSGQAGMVSGKGPVWGADPTYIKRVIAYNLGDREIVGHASARQAMKIAERELAVALKNANQHGRIDPEIMQGVRQTIAAKVAKHVKENPSPGDAVALKALSRVQAAIDDAIEAGGATGWKSYMKAHSKGMQPVDAHNARLAEAARISKEVQSTNPNQMVQDVLPDIPALLHRPTMMANFVLRHIAGSAVDPVTRELATRLQDPKQFLQLMNRPAGSAARQAMDQVLVQASVLENLIRSQYERDKSTDQPTR